jgi:hypothetical protein
MNNTELETLEIRTLPIRGAEIVDVGTFNCWLLLKLHYRIAGITFWVRVLAEKD